MPESKADHSPIRGFHGLNKAADATPAEALRVIQHYVDNGLAIKGGFTIGILERLKITDDELNQLLNISVRGALKLAQSLRDNTNGIANRDVTDYMIVAGFAQNEMERRKYPELTPAVDFLLSRGFHLVGKGKDNSLQLQGPTESLKATVKTELVLVEMQQTYAPGAYYDKRRVSFTLQLMPESFDFSFLNEDWASDEYLNVERGTDTTYKISGALSEIHDIQYDRGPRNFTIVVGPEVKGRFIVESEPTGYSYSRRVHRDKLPREITHNQIIQPPMLSSGDMNVVFQFEETGEGKESLHQIFKKPSEL